MNADEALASSLAKSAHERVGALGLNDREFGKARDQAKVAHFEQGFADGGTVSKIAAGDNDVVGRLPVELFEKFDGKSLLTFETKRVDRIQLVDGSAEN